MRELQRRPSLRALGSGHRQPGALPRFHPLLAPLPVGASGKGATRRAVSSPPLPHGLAGLSLQALGLPPCIRWDAGLAAAWHPGEAAAFARAEAFLRADVADYPERRDLPGQTGTSRLSPHLHFGEIGPRQLVSIARQAGESKGSDAFLRELGWREFAHHLLYHFPHTPQAPLDDRFTAFPWREEGTEALLGAWQRGRTGIPLVDAGMRELWETGWMHNRARMVAASLLTKNLRIPWQLGARWFWDTLVDADLANNTLGWQWTAGCGADAAPYFRVFNPVRQGERFDPDGTYVRRWCPEARRPAAHPHPPALGGPARHPGRERLEPGAGLSAADRRPG